MIMTVEPVVPSKVGTIAGENQTSSGTVFSWTVTAVGTETWTGNGGEKTTLVTFNQSGGGTVSPYKDYEGFYSIGLPPQNSGTISNESIGVSVKSDNYINVMISVISIEYYGKTPVISGEVRGITKVETTDENGIEMKNQFFPHQTVYVMGGGFEPSTTYPLYVVNDTDWIQGTPIPERVQGTETTVTTDENGKIATEKDSLTFPRGTTWTWPLTPGAYDSVIDVNRNGIFDKGIDALDFNQGAGFIVEANTTNLAVIPTAWKDGYYHDYDSIHIPPYVFNDYNVVYNGYPSIRLQTGGFNDPNFNNSKDRAMWIINQVTVKPGDHIVARAWIKTENSSTGNKDWGARIGVDLKGTLPNGTLIILDGYPGDFVPDNSDYVPWGITTWTMRQYDFIVPNTAYITDQYKNYNNPIPPTKIDNITMWFQARPGEDAGSVWIANAELYINPPVAIWAFVPPTIKSCDSTGATKSVFGQVDSTYVSGSGYPVSSILDTYVVAETTWNNGKPIPSRVPGTAPHVPSDINGIIPPTTVWNGPPL
ncbi:MAG TPA: hypothetical protein VK253_06690, partial [Candidatus Binatia bacterium]|nr:hypothetical protein [Candidatus Binatia bacterium]